MLAMATNVKERGFLSKKGFDFQSKEKEIIKKEKQKKKEICFPE